MRFLQKLFNGTSARPAQSGMTATDLARLVGGTLDVVGESRNEQSFRQLLTDAELKTPSGTEKFLPGHIVHEPGNKFDRNALQVYAANALVGYISAEVAEILAPRIASSGGNVPVTVRVWGKYDKRGAVFASARIELN